MMGRLIMYGVGLSIAWYAATVTVEKFEAATAEIVSALPQ